MANYYYVKSGGTAVGTSADSSGTYGIATAPLTGAWPSTTSEYFDSEIAVAASTTPMAEDDVLVHSDASDSSGGDTAVGSVAKYVISVDNSNRENFSSGAISRALDLRPYTTLGISVVRGMTYIVGDDVFYGSASSNMKVYDCDFTANTAGALFLISTDGSNLYVKDTVINASFANSVLCNAGGGAQIVFDNITATGNNGRTEFGAIVGNGGATIEIYNTDLTLFLASSSSLVDADSVADDSCRIKLQRCKLPTDFTVTLSETILHNSTWDIISCDSAGTGYHYFEHFDATTGIRLEDTSNYLSATYDGSNGYSVLMNPNSRVNRINPQRHKLLEIPASDLESTTTYTINFSASTALTKSNFWLEIVRPDATSTALGVLENTREAGFSLINTAGTAHDTYSGTPTWTGGGTNDYEEAITITGMTGVDNGVVEIWVVLAEPDIDVWVCPLPVIT